MQYNDLMVIWQCNKNLNLGKGFDFSNGIREYAPFAKPLIWQTKYA